MTITDYIPRFLKASSTSDDVLRFTAPVEIQAAADGKKRPTFTLNAYSGDPMSVGVFGRVVLDLNGLKAARSKLPILLDHDSRAIVGQADDIAINGSGVKLSGSITGEAGASQIVTEHARNGFEWQASIGAMPEKREFLESGKTATVNGREVTGPLAIIRSATLIETSFVSIGADSSTSATVAASKGQQMETNTTTVNANADQIDRICAGSWTDQQKPDVEALRIQAHAGEITVEQLGQKLVEIVRASRPNVGNKYINANGGPDPAHVLTASLAMNCGVPDKQLAEDYGENVVNEAVSAHHRGATFHSLLRTVINAAGQPVPDSKDGLVRSAFEANQMLRASFSNISLPGILSDVAHKTALSAYRAVPTVWQRVARTSSLTDFKPHRRYRLTGSGRFSELAKDGQLKHVSLTEQEFQVKGKTEGAIIAITRKDLIDDDLGMFGQTMQLLGRMGAIALEREVWTLLLSNPDDFFSEGNNNLVDELLDIDGLTEAENTFFKQTDDNGDPVMIEPTTLLVPTTIATQARQLINSTEIIGGGGDDRPNANPHNNRFALATSPWLNAQGLSGSSDNAWYLLGSPGDVSAMEVGFLNGNANPIVESGQADFDQLGIQMRAYHDFGVAMGDHRAAVKSDGIGST